VRREKGEKKEVKRGNDRRKEVKRGVTVFGAKNNLWRKNHSKPALTKGLRLVLECTKCLVPGYFITHRRKFREEACDSLVIFHHRLPIIVVAVLSGVFRLVVGDFSYRFEAEPADLGSILFESFSLACFHQGDDCVSVR